MRLFPVSGIHSGLGTYLLRVRGNDIQIDLVRLKAKNSKKLRPLGAFCLLIQCRQSHWIPHLCTFITHKYGVWLCRWLFSRQWRTGRGPRRLQTETTLHGEINRGQAEQKENYFSLWWQKMEVSLVCLSCLILSFLFLLFCPASLKHTKSSWTINQ